MSSELDPRSVPVLLLYNVDPSWDSHECDEIDALACQLGSAMSDVGHPVTPVRLSRADLEAALAPHVSMSGVVFNWCDAFPGVRHGESLVAGVLERMGFAFTGGGSHTLELAQNKRRVKEILDAAAVPTPRWRVFDRPSTSGWDRFPAIVKAVHEHSSEGITSEAVVSDDAELADRISFILEAYGQPALVEDFIDGREFHVSLWGNGTIEVLPVAEMDFSRFADIHDRLCTYDSKFVPGSVHYEGIETILPAALDDAERRELERVCLAAYTAVGCRDYGRIDVRVRDGVFNVLDVNPNADISADASLACSAQLAGYSYGDMASRIVRLAALRHPDWSGDIGGRSSAGSMPCGCMDVE